MDFKQLMSKVRKAVDDYNMISNGDKVAVGISGGKDSLTLLYALSGLKRFYPCNFELEAITVDLGFNDAPSILPIEAFCNDLGINYHLVKTDIAEVVFDSRKETNPCSLCAKMRKGAFNDKAKELGCNKIAYGHHKDDIIDTFILSLIYEGRLNTFSPVTYLDRTNLTLIRPLMYVNEADVIGFKNKYSLPVWKNPCPADGKTKREYANDLLNYINKDAPGVKDHVFNAILKGEISGYKLISPEDRASLRSKGKEA